MAQITIKIGDFKTRAASRTLEASWPEAQARPVVRKLSISLLEQPAAPMRAAGQMPRPVVRKSSISLLEQPAAGQRPRPVVRKSWISLLEQPAAHWSPAGQRPCSKEIIDFLTRGGPVVRKS